MREYSLFAGRDFLFLILRYTILRRAETATPGTQRFPEHLFLPSKGKIMKSVQKVAPAIRNSVFLLFLLSSFFTIRPSILSAQIPRTISYQGILANASGVFIPDGTH